MDDDFYKSLAAEANDTVSDTSEAEVGKTSKSISLDELDEQLFGKKEKTPNPKSTTQAKGNGNSSVTNSSKFNFDFDEDDPLAGLLSDDDEPAPKKGPPVKETNQERVIKDSSKSTPTSSDFKEEIVKKPSNKQSDSNKNVEDSMFDDDDVLGDMGLQSPVSSPTRETKKSTIEQSTQRAKSVLDDFLSTDELSSKKPIVQNKIPSQIDKAGVSDKSTEEDFMFGSYQPSSVSTKDKSSLRPSTVDTAARSSRRTVRFEDGDVNSRGQSAPEGGRRQQNKSSYLEDLIKNDDRDWLELATNDQSGTSSRNTNRRTGSNVTEDSVNTSTDGSNEFNYAKPVSVNDRDLSYLPRKNINESEEHKFTGAKADDYLGLSEESPIELKNSAPQPSSSDDWLGLIKKQRDEFKRRDSVPGHDSTSQSEDPTKTLEDNTLNASVLPWESNEPSTSTFNTNQSPVTTSQPRNSRRPPKYSQPSKPDSLTQNIQTTDTNNANLSDTTNKRSESTVLENQNHPTIQLAEEFKLVQSTSQQQLPVEHSSVNKVVRQQTELQPTVGTTQIQRLSEAQRQNSSLSTPLNNNILQTATPTNYADAGIIQRLQLEKDHLESLIETIKRQHQSEIEFITESHRKQNSLLEETYARRESSLKEENKILSERNVEKLKIAEQEKISILESHMNQLKEVQSQKLEEINQLKMIHRSLMDDLRHDHERTIEQLRRSKNDEVEAAVSSTSHTKQMQEVIGQIKDNAESLNLLKVQVETDHSSSLNSREHAAHSRDVQLKALQERLEREHHEMEQERARLQGLVTKLESQITTQARDIEEERWRLRQEEVRYESAKRNLEQEKTLILEQTQRDRLEIEKAKDKLIAEQHESLKHVHEERRLLAEERARFNVTQKLQASQHDSSINTLVTEAELESSIKTVNQEKAHIRSQKEELRIQIDKLKTEQSILEEQKQSTALERDRLEKLATQVKSRSQEINELVVKATQTKEEGEQALREARQIEATHAHREKQNSDQLANIRAKEQHTAQDRLALACEKQELELRKNKLLCVNCSTPVKESRNKVPNFVSEVQFNGSVAAQNLYKSLSPDVQNRLNGISRISSAIEADHSMRLWKISAQKDKSFLEEEMLFLEGLKHSPYFNSKSEET